MPPNPFTALVIINPRSRRGSDAEFSDCVSLLTQKGLKIIKVQSHGARLMGELIAMHRGRVNLVVLAGGDGTVSSAAEALYQYKLPFAILPMGTANDLARSLKLPTDLPDACQAIIANRRQKIDLAVVNGRYFFNAANLGLGVKVTHELTPEIKRRWGVFSYLKALFSAMHRKEVFRAIVTIDGKVHRMKSMHIAVGNGRYYGGGNIIDENATINNGLLCLYSLKPQNFWNLLILAPLLRNGKQRRAPTIFRATGRRIEIRTRRPMEIDADGEPVAHTPAIFEVLPKALEVIAPGVEAPEKPVEQKQQTESGVPA